MKHISQTLSSVLSMPCCLKLTDKLRTGGVFVGTAKLIPTAKGVLFGITGCGDDKRGDGAQHFTRECGGGY